MDAEPPTWSIEDHLCEGVRAIKTIAERQGEAQPICHHFSELCPVDPVTISIAETYGTIAAILEAQGLEYLGDRLEAWETGLPTGEWLDDRVPTLVSTASAHGLRYEGWTWEPHDGAPVGACTFAVINNRVSPGP
jgi:hypothetical protein